MSFSEMLYAVIIGPIELFFEIFFYIVNNIIIHNPAISIAVLSVSVNVLVLPLYMQADALQEKVRKKEKAMEKGVLHIRKTFSGNERTMMLQTYYRQNDYRPFDSLNNIVSLMLQVPFFVAAYHFLSNLEDLQGASFGPITDLAKPDVLLTAGGVQVNVLPILMTVVNLITCVIFTKGYPLKSKLQLYGMALIFLILLYDSPSGLVLYWTLNNLFSLIKTVFYKLKHAKEILKVLLALAGVGILIGAFNVYQEKAYKMVGILILAGIGLVCLIPFMIMLLQKKGVMKERQKKPKPTELLPKESGSLFFVVMLFMTVLAGVLIPTAVLQASPQEFFDPYHFVHPLWYVCNTFCYAVGVFMLWFQVFHFLAGQKAGRMMTGGSVAVCVCALVNYMFFGKNLGNLDNTLVFDKPMSFSTSEKMVNLLVIIFLFALTVVLFKKREGLLKKTVLAGVLAILLMSIFNIVDIEKDVLAFQNSETFLNDNDNEDLPSFRMSKSGRNVVLIMTDRAIAGYIPYFINEKPELREAYSGFTYFPNTLSHGHNTVSATPSFFGGYEYTPAEMNKRTGDTMVSKHNEALKVLPVMFLDEGYKVTVCEPPFAGYQYIPDLSIYKEYSDISTYITTGKFRNSDNPDETEELSANDRERQFKRVKRNFVCYAVMKELPVIFQNIVYCGGTYYMPMDDQIVTGKYTASGKPTYFLQYFSVLQHFADMTEITESHENTFMMISNNATHEQTMLQEPSYTPSLNVDNTQYETENAGRYTLDGRTIRMETPNQMMHYQTDMAVLLEIGSWLQCLKENDLYDNTRIIIAGDHGFNLNTFPWMDWDGGADARFGVENCNPLLLVKDFEETEFKSSDEFMTTADIPLLCVKGIIDNPVNPFTGKQLTDEEKYKHDQYVYSTYEPNPKRQNKTTFISGNWYSVHSDVRNPANWKLLTTDSLSPFGDE